MRFPGGCWVEGDTIRLPRVSTKPDYEAEMAFIIGPIFFVMLGGACVIGWRLDARRHAGIRAELDARDAVFAEAPIVESPGAQPAIAVLAEEG